MHDHTSPNRHDARSRGDVWPQQLRRAAEPCRVRAAGAIGRDR